MPSPKMRGSLTYEAADNPSEPNWPILACSWVSSASPIACTASALPENVETNPLIAYRFQAAIIVWWMPCLADSSASVCSPRIASNATLV